MLVRTRTHWREAECLSCNSCQLWAWNTAGHLPCLPWGFHIWSQGDPKHSTERGANPIRQNRTCLLGLCLLPPTEIKAPRVRYQGIATRKGQGCLDKKLDFHLSFRLMIFGGGWRVALNLHWVVYWGLYKNRTFSLSTPNPTLLYLCGAGAITQLWSRKTPLHHPWMLNFLRQTLGVHGVPQLESWW